VSNPKTWDEYEIKARYIPCFITAVPIVHFCTHLLGKTFWESIASNMGWMLVTNLGLSLIVTLALIQLQSGIAKHWIEESVFGKGGINFPTTNILLFQDNFLSRTLKNTLREKIKRDFQFVMLDETKEGQDMSEAKRLAREAVNFIRNYVGKGRMTHHYNIRYGFMRNIIGGALWAFVGSTGNGLLYGLQKHWAAMGLFVLFAFIFLALIVFKKPILSRYGNQYAETLFSEYLTMKGNSR